jgi:hypothetical protein
MSDYQIELKEAAERRVQQDTEIPNRKNVFDRANRTSTSKP